MRRILIGLICIIFIMGSGGCSKVGDMLFREKREWQPVKPKETAYIHTVKWREETLQVIAAWYTGDKGNWQALADANPIINPDHLCIGDKIFIPQGLLKSREPLPKGFSRKNYQKTPAPLPPAGGDDELVLFGPK